MSAKLPQITFAAHWLLTDLREFIGWVLLGIDKLAHKRIDLRWLEAGDFYVEVALGKQIGEFAQFGGKNSAIPARVGRNLIIGQG
jgi:hypothetical protein